MLFYDWKKMFKVSEGNPLVLYTLFKMITNKEIPRNKYDDIYKFAGKQFNGESYIIHPDVLLHNSYKHSYREIAQYLALASMRPYADYIVTGEPTLDLQQCEVDQEFFENNSLLHIENDKIHFLYEEVKQENIH
ncbi:MAG TPA: hypothetical protein DCW83_13525 [Saprospirales bacterium]|jgi:hypothetical protein|nr:hypothetical protein [Saprospirales bacterium]HCD67823.1 hypothetical protein [Bacteroidota bacterium]